MSCYFCSIRLGVPVAMQPKSKKCTQCGHAEPNTERIVGRMGTGDIDDAGFAYHSVVLPYGDEIACSECGHKGTEVRLPCMGMFEDEDPAHLRHLSENSIEVLEEEFSYAEVCSQSRQKSTGGSQG